MNTKNLKPLDLEAALLGEPVILRNGSKAYVRHHETELPTEMNEVLLGYDDAVVVCSWNIEGAYIEQGHESVYDIIGMYPKTRTVNGFEVPAPETEELNYADEYFLATTLTEYFYRDEIWKSHLNDKLWLERGLVFLHKEDAVANAKAMLGIDPKEEVIK